MAVHWAVTFWLTPAELHRLDRAELRERCDPVVAGCAAAAGLGWDAECLAEYLRDVLRGRAERGDGSFATLWPPSYRIYAVELAQTAESAERQAAAGITIPDGFSVRTTVRPADLSDRGYQRPMARDRRPRRQPS